MKEQEISLKMKIFQDGRLKSRNRSSQGASKDVKNFVAHKERMKNVDVGIGIELERITPLIYASTSHESRVFQQCRSLRLEYRSSEFFVFLSDFLPLAQTVPLLLHNIHGVTRLFFKTLFPRSIEGSQFLHFRHSIIGAPHFSPLMKLLPSIALDLRFEFVHPFVNHVIDWYLAILGCDIEIKKDFIQQEKNSGGVLSSGNAIPEMNSDYHDINDIDTTEDVTDGNVAEQSTEKLARLMDNHNIDTISLVFRSLGQIVKYLHPYLTTDKEILLKLVIDKFGMLLTHQKAEFRQFAAEIVGFIIRRAVLRNDSLDKQNFGSMEINSQLGRHPQHSPIYYDIIKGLLAVTKKETENMTNVSSLFPLINFDIGITATILFESIRSIQNSTHPIYDEILDGVLSWSNPNHDGDNSTSVEMSVNKAPSSDHIVARVSSELIGKCCVYTSDTDTLRAFVSRFIRIYDDRHYSNAIIYFREMVVELSRASMRLSQLVPKIAKELFPITSIVISGDSFVHEMVQQLTNPFFQQIITLAFSRIITKDLASWEDIRRKISSGIFRTLTESVSSHLALDFLQKITPSGEPGKAIGRDVLAILIPVCMNALSGLHHSCFHHCKDEMINKLVPQSTLVLQIFDKIVSTLHQYIIIKEEHVIEMINASLGVFAVKFSPEYSNSNGVDDQLNHLLVTSSFLNSILSAGFYPLNPQLKGKIKTKVLSLLEDPTIPLQIKTHLLEALTAISMELNREAVITIMMSLNIKTLDDSRCFDEGNHLEIDTALLINAIRYNIEKICPRKYDQSIEENIFTIVQRATDLCFSESAELRSSFVKLVSVYYEVFSEVILPVDEINTSSVKNNVDVTKTIKEIRGVSSGINLLKGLSRLDEIHDSINSDREREIVTGSISKSLTQMLLQFTFSGSLPVNIADTDCCDAHTQRTISHRTEWVMLLIRLTVRVICGQFSSRMTDTWFLAYNTLVSFLRVDISDKCREPVDTSRNVPTEERGDHILRKTVLDEMFAVAKRCSEMFSLLTFNSAADSTLRSEKFLETSCPETGLGLARVTNLHNFLFLALADLLRNSQIRYLTRSSPELIWILEYTICMTDQCFYKKIDKRRCLFVECLRNVLESTVATIELLTGSMSISSSCTGESNSLVDSMRSISWKHLLTEMSNAAVKEKKTSRKGETSGFSSVRKVNSIPLNGIRILQSKNGWKYIGSYSGVFDKIVADTMFRETPIRVQPYTTPDDPVVTDRQSLDWNTSDTSKRRIRGESDDWQNVVLIPKEHAPLFCLTLGRLLAGLSLKQPYADSDKTSGGSVRNRIVMYLLRFPRCLHSYVCAIIDVTSTKYASHDPESWSCVQSKCKQQDLFERTTNRQPDYERNAVMFLVCTIPLIEGLNRYTLSIDTAIKSFLENQETDNTEVDNQILEDWEFAMSIKSSVGMAEILERLGNITVSLLVCEWNGKSHTRITKEGMRLLSLLFASSSSSSSSVPWEVITSPVKEFIVRWISQSAHHGTKCSPVLKLLTVCSFTFSHRYMNLIIDWLTPRTEGAVVSPDSESGGMLTASYLTSYLFVPQGNTGAPLSELLDLLMHIVFTSNELLEEAVSLLGNGSMESTQTLKSSQVVKREHWRKAGNEFLEEFPLDQRVNVLDSYRDSSLQSILSPSYIDWSAPRRAWVVPHADNVLGSLTSSLENDDFRDPIRVSRLLFLIGTFSSLVSTENSERLITTTKVLVNAISCLIGTDHKKVRIHLKSQYIISVFDNLINSRILSRVGDMYRSSSETSNRHTSYATSSSVRELYTLVERVVRLIITSFSEIKCRQVATVALAEMTNNERCAVILAGLTSLDRKTVNIDPDLDEQTRVLQALIASFKEGESVSIDENGITNEGNGKHSYTTSRLACKSMIAGEPGSRISIHDSTRKLGVYPDIILAHLVWQLGESACDLGIRRLCEQCIEEYINLYGTKLPIYSQINPESVTADTPEMITGISAPQNPFSYYLAHVEDIVIRGSWKTLKQAKDDACVNSALQCIFRSVIGIGQHVTCSTSSLPHSHRKDIRRKLKIRVSEKPEGIVNHNGDATSVDSGPHMAFSTHGVNELVSHPLALHLAPGNHSKIHAVSTGRIIDTISHLDLLGAIGRDQIGKDPSASLNDLLDDLLDLQRHRRLKGMALLGRLAITHSLLLSSTVTNILYPLAHYHLQKCTIEDKGMINLCCEIFKYVAFKHSIKFSLVSIKKFVRSVKSIEVLEKETNLSKILLKAIASICSGIASLISSQDRPLPYLVHNTETSILPLIFSLASSKVRQTLSNTTNRKVLYSYRVRKSAINAYLELILALENSAKRNDKVFSHSKPIKRTINFKNEILRLSAIVVNCMASEKYVDRKSARDALVAICTSTTSFEIITNILRTLRVRMSRGGYLVAVCVYSTGNVLTKWANHRVNGPTSTVGRRTSRPLVEKNFLTEVLNIYRMQESLWWLTQSTNENIMSSRDQISSVPEGKCGTQLLLVIGSHFCSLDSILRYLVQPLYNTLLVIAGEHTNSDLNSNNKKWIHAGRHLPKNIHHMLMGETARRYFSKVRSGIMTLIVHCLENSGQMATSEAGAIALRILQRCISIVKSAGHQSVQREMNGAECVDTDEKDINNPESKGREIHSNIIPCEGVIFLPECAFVDPSGRLGRNTQDDDITRRDNILVRVATDEKVINIHSPGNDAHFCQSSRIRIAISVGIRMLNHFLIGMSASHNIPVIDTNEKTTPDDSFRCVNPGNIPTSAEIREGDFESLIRAIQFFICSPEFNEVFSESVKCITRLLTLLRDRSKIKRPAFTNSESSNKEIEIGDSSTYEKVIIVPKCLDIFMICKVILQMMDNLSSDFIDVGFLLTKDKQKHFGTSPDELSSSCSRLLCLILSNKWGTRQGKGDHIEEIQLMSSDIIEALVTHLHIFFSRHSEEFGSTCLVISSLKLLKKVILPRQIFPGCVSILCDPQGYLKVTMNSSADKRNSRSSVSNYRNRKPGDVLQMIPLSPEEEKTSECSDSVVLELYQVMDLVLKKVILESNSDSVAAMGSECSCYFLLHYPHAIRKLRVTIKDLVKLITDPGNSYGHKKYPANLLYALVQNLDLKTLTDDNIRMDPASLMNSISSFILAKVFPSLVCEASEDTKILLREFLRTLLGRLLFSEDPESGYRVKAKGILAGFHHNITRTIIKENAQNVENTDSHPDLHISKVDPILLVAITEWVTLLLEADSLDSDQKGCVTIASTREMIELLSLCASMIPDTYGSSVDFSGKNEEKGILLSMTNRNFVFYRVLKAYETVIKSVPPGGDTIEIYNQMQKEPQIFPVMANHEHQIILLRLCGRELFSLLRGNSDDIGVPSNNGREHQLHPWNLTVSIRIISYYLQWNVHSSSTETCNQHGISNFMSLIKDIASMDGIHFLFKVTGRLLSCTDITTSLLWESVCLIKLAVVVSRISDKFDMQIEPRCSNVQIGCSLASSNSGPETNILRHGWCQNLIWLFTRLSSMSRALLRTSSRQSNNDSSINEYGIQVTILVIVKECLLQVSGFFLNDIDNETINLRALLRSCLTILLRFSTSLTEMRDNIQFSQDDLPERTTESSFMRLLGRVSGARRYFSQQFVLTLSVHIISGIETHMRKTLGRRHHFVEQWFEILIEVRSSLLKSRMIRKQQSKMEYIVDQKAFSQKKEGILRRKISTRKRSAMEIEGEWRNVKRRLQKSQ